MSALGQKQTFSGSLPNVCFRGSSGRKSQTSRRSAYSHKRTFRSGLHYMEVTAVSALPSRKATYRFLREVFLGVAFFAAGFRFFGSAAAFFFGLIAAFVFFGLAGAASASITP